MSLLWNSREKKTKYNCLKDMNLFFYIVNLMCPNENYHEK